MTLSRLIVLLAVSTLLGIQEIRAEETDQFTLPPTALQDIGPIASQRLYKVLEEIVAQTNSEIQRYTLEAAHSRFAASQLASRLNKTTIADKVYAHTGPGFPRWLRGTLSTDKPVFHKENLPWNNVYWLVFSQSPFSLMRLAPTIVMYGYEFGTDKLGHFFMMGHTYYKMYQYFLAHGKSAEQAHAALVAYGKFLEFTYLGVLVNGVYSNGDLAANYSGWKFYTNLTEAVKIGNKTQAPILIWSANQWKFAKHVTPDNLLKPYISDNLNEAYNPCRYTFMRNQIRQQVKKRCAGWIEQRGLNKAIVQAKLDETKLWHGEQYGRWLPDNSAVTLDVCFGG